MTRSRTEAARSGVGRRWPPVVEMMDEDMAAVLAGKTGAERLAIAFEMSRSGRRMLHSHLARENPDWSQEEVDAEVARRMSRGSG